MSFIRNYLEYVKRDEAHENYHLWTCLVVIASLVGRKVWVERPYQTIFANLYVILVGPQGNRKTGAKDIGQELMRECGGVQFSCEATTRESLIDQMKRQEEAFTYKNKTDTYCSLTICATEFKEFVAKDPVGIITFLTAIYDRNFFDYGTMKRGVDVLINPYMNMIACETPEWITNRLKESVVTGGFSRRVTYIYETTHKTFIDEAMSPECKAAKDLLLKDSARIKSLTGNFVLSEAARAWYNHWYTHPITPKDACLVGFYESKHTLLTKIAMLVSVSEGAVNGNLIIDKPHFELALEMINACEGNMVKVFAGGGRNELGTVSIKVMDLLEREKRPIPEKDIYVMLFQDCRDQREMESVITHLVRSEKVIRFSKTTGAVVRAFLCSRGHLPSDVLKEVERVAASSKDVSSSNNPPPAPSASPAGAPDLLQVLQPAAPTASSASPSGTQSDAVLDTLKQSPPSTQ